MDALSKTGRQPLPVEMNMGRNKSIMGLMRTGKLLSIVIFSIAIISCNKEYKDQEGKSLKTVKIGDQTWMAENLDVRHFRNGDSIPEAKSQEEWIRLGSEGKPAFLTDKVNSGNIKKYGNYYNWYAVNDPRGLAPEGWHVPTNEEWNQMTGYLGGEVAAALQMRITGYDDNGVPDSQSGFSGFPAGSCAGDGKFYGSGTNGYWWSSTEVNPAEAYILLLNYIHCNIYEMSYYKAGGLSVRCLRD